MLSPSTHAAADVIRLLGLEPIPHEGGYFRRTAEANLAPGETRRAWSAIYALFTPDGFSALHRLKSDEVWCFHSGDALESLRLHEDGHSETVRLGLDPARGEKLQDVVRAGVWQGTRLADGGRWALVTCLVVPEFRWEEFELGDRATLSAKYPASAEFVRRLTREPSQT